MAIYINTSILKYGELRVESRARKTAGAAPPPPTDNLVKAVINYAQFMGLSAIPAPTIEKLKDDPYFKYALTRVMYYQDVYRPDSWLGKSVRADLEKAIKDPSSVTEESLYKGIQFYLGNFMHNMPGGHYHSSLEYLLKKMGIKPGTREQAEEQKKRKQLFELIDKILADKGLKGRFPLISADKDREGWGRFERHLEFVKIGLEIFHTLVDKYHYDPEYLIK